MTQAIMRFRKDVLLLALKLFMIILLSVSVLAVESWM